MDSASESLWRRRGLDLLARIERSPLAPTALREFLRRLGAELEPRWREVEIRHWVTSTRDAPRSISVIIGVRNRAGSRLSNCLRTLTRQSYPAALTELILVDYGSDEQVRDELRGYAESFGARLVRVEAEGEWSRARCLNIGLDHVQSRFVLFGDVDLLFSSDYLHAAVEALEAEPMAATYSHVWDLPETENEVLSRTTDELDLALLRRRATPRFHSGWIGKGIFATYTRHAREVGMFDERFEGWGGEDDDMFARLKAHGVRPKNIDSETAFYLHQWHPKYLGVSQQRIDQIRAHAERSRRSRRVVHPEAGTR